MLKSQCMAGEVLVTWAYFAGTKTNVARARHALKSFNLDQLELSMTTIPRSDSAKRLQAVFD